MQENDDTIDPYSDLIIDSKYYDMYTLPSILNDSDSPIFLSINIQSLLSKYEELRFFITDMSRKKVSIDVIAIQEVWEIQQPELLPIPGFQTIIHKSQTNMRGGVGFYVRDGINFKIIENLSPFEQKRFEAITIQVSYPNKSILLTSAYRSNGPLPNLTSSKKMERFQTIFGELLSNLNNSHLTSYVFIDANIDLLNMYSEDSSNYLNNVLSNGFIQQIMKATRFQNQNKTLLDHILTSCHSNRIYSGSVLSDIRYHFFTFTRPVLPHIKKQTKFTTARNFSQTSLNQFKTALSGTDWSHVTNSNDVDDAYELFWNSYSELFDVIFPKKKVRFNRNIHKMSPFMTAGLLVSRTTKNKLFKAKLPDNSAANLQKYKDFKTVYSKTSRAAKKLYYQQKFEANVKNPKKTWETLNEVMGKEKRSANVEKININGNISSDPSDMANHFNESFTQIGKKISNSIPSVHCHL